MVGSRIDAEALKGQVAKGLGDGEILAWMLANAKHARAAYEMIVTAFAEGDRRSLRNLLSKEVFDGFERICEFTSSGEYRAFEGASSKVT